MRNAGVITTVFLRELLRLTAWLTKFDNIDLTRITAAYAMAELAREAAYGLETTAGPFQRLYWLAWQCHTHADMHGTLPRWQDVEHQLPSPTTEDVKDLCWAYSEVAYTSLEAEVSIADVITVMESITEYRFSTDDVFELLYRIEGLETSAVIMNTAVQLKANKPLPRHVYRSFAALLLSEEVEKAENWLYAHMF